MSDASSVPETRTTMCGQTRVQCHIKVPGGTMNVIHRTLTVVTCEEITARTPTVWSGTTGLVTITL